MSDEAAIKRIGVVMPGIVWAVMLAQVKLALRHPGNTEGAAADIGRMFARHLEDILVAEGVYTREEIEELHAMEKGQVN